MATLQPLTKRSDTAKRPWRARVKFQYVEYFLGSFETKEEAEKVENDFRVANGVQLKTKQS